MDSKYPNRWLPASFILRQVKCDARLKKSFKWNWFNFPASGLAETQDINSCSRGVPLENHGLMADITCESLFIQQLLYSAACWQVAFLQVCVWFLQQISCSWCRRWLGGGPRDNRVQHGKQTSYADDITSLIFLSSTGHTFTTGNFPSWGKQPMCQKLPNRPLLLAFRLMRFLLGTYHR